MSTCNPQTLLNDGKCFYGVGAKEGIALRLQLLCEVKSGIDALSAAVSGLVGALPTVAAVTYAASVDVDLDLADYQTIALTGDIDFTTSLNRPATGFAKAVAMVLTADGSDRALTYNASWVPVGTAPTQVSAGKTGVLSITAIGPAETDVIIAYQEEP